MTAILTPAARFPQWEPTPLHDALVAEYEARAEALALYAAEYPTAGPCRRAWLRELVRGAA